MSDNTNHSKVWTRAELLELPAEERNVIYRDALATEPSQVTEELLAWARSSIREQIAEIKGSATAQ